MKTLWKFKNYGTRCTLALTMPDDAEGYAKLGAFGITKVAGGISEMRKIYDLAEMKGVKLVPHGFSTGILLAATVQFLAACEQGDLMEYSQSTSPLFTDLVRNRITFEDGYVKVPDCIGLGIEFDENLIDKYRMD